MMILLNKNGPVGFKKWKFTVLFKSESLQCFYLISKQRNRNFQISDFLLLKINAADN